MPYREELEALDARVNSLENQLAEARAAGDALRKRRRLIALPCDVPWSAMRGDDRVRHCGRCEKSVHNLTAMTSAEVDAFLERTEDPCIRYFQRPDGTVLTSDCSIRPPAKRLAAIAGSAVMAGAIATWAFTPIDMSPRSVSVALHSRGEMMRVEGELALGSLHTDLAGTTFTLVNAGASLPVRARIVPDTLSESEEGPHPLAVLVEGELGADGVFDAKNVLAKVPSGAYGITSRRPREVR